MLHDADLAEAILDRVLERGRVLPFKGPSYRTRRLRTEGGSEVSRKGVPDFREPAASADQFACHCPGASRDVTLPRSECAIPLIRLARYSTKSNTIGRPIGPTWPSASSSPSP